MMFCLRPQQHCSTMFSVADDWGWAPSLQKLDFIVFNRSGTLNLSAGSVMVCGEVVFQLPSFFILVIWHSMCSSLVFFPKQNLGSRTLTVFSWCLVRLIKWRSIQTLTFGASCWGWSPWRLVLLSWAWFASTTPHSWEMNQAMKILLDGTLWWRTCLAKYYVFAQTVMCFPKSRSTLTTWWSMDVLLRQQVW